MFICLLVLVLVNEKVVEVRHVDISPKIDGVIENIWSSADSAFGFVQLQPDEGEPAQEPTVVYILTDDANLYFAFRCYTPGRKPFVSFKGYEDHMYLYLDSFGNKTTAYFFGFCASGYKEEGMLLENGKIMDQSWDGVWFFGVHIGDTLYEMEVMIPFRTIRYKKGLEEWGLDFFRYSVKNDEISYWTAVNQRDGLQVSEFGKLQGVVPKVMGYHIELYPEGYFRYDQTVDAEQYKPSASFNFKWDLTPQTTANATIYPDFAHIESDPYRLNLTRYPIRLDERRPFFVEGSDVLRMSSLGRYFFQPLEIFYSRRIGKPLTAGGSVPVLGGLKIINKTKGWNWGLISAVTDTTIETSRQAFCVVRSSHSVFENSEIGVLFSSTASDRDNYNYAAGIDAVYRLGSSQFILQSAMSDRNAKRGWAISSGGLYNANAYEIRAGALAVDDSFDVWDIGYVPWSGLRSIYLSAGPRWLYKKSTLRSLYIGPGISLTKETGVSDWSKIVIVSIEPRLRNRLGGYFNASAGQKNEANTTYFYRSIELGSWSGYRQKYDLGFGANQSFCFNYRQNWLANQLSTWLWLAVFPVSSLSIRLSADMVYEWNPEGDITAITPYITPRVEYKFTADIEAALYSQLVFTAVTGDLESAEIYSNRIGFLFSWNFRPKSWFYIAFNDYREQNTEGSLILQNRVGAIKAKYLIYF